MPPLHTIPGRPQRFMVIKFSCPQGHSLSCPDDQAGKSARCPKCNARLTVPDESEERADGGDADNAPDTTPPTDSASTAEVVTPVGDQQVESAADTTNGVPESKASGTEDEIVFLCPNGHQLNGPARLQGRPGQCPHCGEKFRIPSYDDVDDANDDEYADDEIPMGTIVDDEEIGMEDLEGIDEFHDEYDLDDDKHDAHRGQIPVAVEVNDEPVAPPLPVRQHPLAQLIAQLWKNKGEGQQVELYLGQGEAIGVDIFSVSLSQQTHGVFATQEDDGTYSVTTIAWDAIVRVGFRKLKQLPKGMF